MKVNKSLLQKLLVLLLAFAAAAPLCAMGGAAGGADAGPAQKAGAVKEVELMQLMYFAVRNNREKFEDMLKGDEDRKRSLATKILLRVAAEYGDHDVPNAYLHGVERAVAAGADVSTRGKDGMTPLQVAAKNGPIEVVQALLSGLPDDARFVAVTAGCGVDRLTPLHLAIDKKRLEVVILMLHELTDANRVAVLQRKDFFGMTLLHYAAMQGNIPIVWALLMYGADRNITTARGRTAADVARDFGHKILAELIEKYQPGARAVGVRAAGAGPVGAEAVKEGNNRFAKAHCVYRLRK